MISSITEGGLEIKVKPPDANGKYHSCTYEVEDKLDWPCMSSNLDDYGKQVQQILDATFSWRIPAVVESITHKLNDQNKLYLPGSGSFFFKNGTFNSKGDFLTQIQYDGVNWDRISALDRFAEKQKTVRNIPQHEPRPLEPLKLTMNFADTKHMQGWTLLDHLAQGGTVKG